VNQPLQNDPYCGVFASTLTADGRRQLRLHPDAPETLPDPRTGRALRIAAVEVGPSICPSCDGRAGGGYISFVADLRFVYACPECQQMIWLHGS
jgi:hypothetical protein